MTKVRVRATKNANDFQFAKEYVLDLNDPQDKAIYDAYAYEPGGHSPGDFLAVISTEEDHGDDRDTRSSRSGSADTGGTDTGGDDDGDDTGSSDSVASVDDDD